MNLTADFPWLPGRGRKEPAGRVGLVLSRTLDALVARTAPQMLINDGNPRHPIAFYTHYSMFERRRFIIFQEKLFKGLIVICVHLQHEL